MTTQTINLNNLKKGDTCVGRNGWRQVWDGLKYNYDFETAWEVGGACFNQEGRFSASRVSPFDIIEIIPAPEPIVRYVNLYTQGSSFPYLNKEGADHWAKPDRIVCLKITYCHETGEASAEVIEADNKAGGEQ